MIRMTNGGALGRRRFVWCAVLVGCFALVAVRARADWDGAAAPATRAPTRPAAGEPMGMATVRNVQMAADSTGRLRVTGRFGSFEMTKPTVGTNGIFSRHVEVAGTATRVPERLIPWSDIDRIEARHDRARTGAAVGAGVAMAGAGALVLAKSDHADGIGVMLVSLGVLVFAEPVVFGARVLGGLYGHQIEDWRVCYEAGDGPHAAAATTPRPASSP